MHGYLNSHLAEILHVLSGCTDLKGENLSNKTLPTTTKPVASENTLLFYFCLAEESLTP